jgi:hypothetical protein
MTVTCPTITVTAPPAANITATSITPSVTTCQEPCSLTVSVTWTNQGGTADTFIPNILVDSVAGTPFPSESLNPGASTTHSFSVSGLSHGSHTICPSPN